MRFGMNLVFIAGLVLGAITSSMAGELPSLSGRVVDNAHLMSAPAKTALTEKLRALEEKTTAQVVVLTVPDIGEYPDMKAFGIDLARAWKIGQKDKNNGLILMYSVKGDHYRVEVGYGLEGSVPDAIAKSIITGTLRAKANPKIGTHDFDGAFSDAVDEVSKIIIADGGGKPGDAKRDEGGGGLILALVVLVVIGLAFRPFWAATIGGVVSALAAVPGGTTLGVILLLGVIGGIVALFVSAVVRNLNGIGFGDSDLGSSDGSGLGSIIESVGDSFSGGGGDFGGGGADD